MDKSSWIGLIIIAMAAAAVFYLSRLFLGFIVDNWLFVLIAIGIGVGLAYYEVVREEKKSAAKRNRL